jgi:phage terminase large subunit GpA-like protein
VQRTLTYNNRKIVAGSTPVHADTSAIITAYAESDQRIYEVACPHCGGLFEVLWEHIIWPPGEPNKAACQCAHCQQSIEERHKPAMVAAGQWRATKPEVKGHAGFRLNALVSPLANASWAKLATEFLTGKDHPDLLQPFMSTVLAQGWSGPGGDLEEGKLQARAEAFDLDHIPKEVLVATIGADVQEYRIEASVLGWTKMGECLILGHFVIWGSFTDSGTWAEFDDKLRRLHHQLKSTLNLKPNEPEPPFQTLQFVPNHLKTNIRVSNSNNG